MRQLRREVRSEPAAQHERPRTRLECFRLPRPCPFVGCRFNLFLDVTHNGSIKLNFPDLEPWQMPPGSSCVLDVVARRGSISLDKIGPLMNLTRERIRQLQDQALERLERSKAARALEQPRPVLPPHPGLAKCGLRAA